MFVKCFKFVCTILYPHKTLLHACTLVHWIYQCKTYVIFTSHLEYWTIDFKGVSKSNFQGSKNRNYLKYIVHKYNFYNF